MSSPASKHPGHVSDREVMRALIDAYESDETLIGDVVSKHAVAERVGLSPDRVRDRLRTLADSGRVERARTVDVDRGKPTIGHRPLEGEQ